MFDRSVSAQLSDIYLGIAFGGLFEALSFGREEADMGKKKLPQNLQEWVEVRKRFHLSHAQVQMARELGMNPKKLGKLANHRQEPWKAPLPQFIEYLYVKRFGRELPEVVMSIEERASAREAQSAARRAMKCQAGVE